MGGTVSNKQACVLLTGVTGFLGKVVLAELLRRRHELEIARIVVIVRDRANEPAGDRFRKRVLASGALAALPAGVASMVEVVAGDLSRPGCGLPDVEHRRLAASVTHVVHCAASVEFDLPLDLALAANATSALNVLALAKASAQLARMVSVSTAYVTRHCHGPIRETLGPLPREAESLYGDILAGRADERALLRDSGHPNTYTLTKCLAEHLLVARREQTPLTIVRPSIISACWRHPFAGWIDSKAALAAFVALMGAGVMRAVVADPVTQLDIVPCDEVAARVIDEAFAPADRPSPELVHATAGRSRSLTVERIAGLLVAFFQDHPVHRPARLAYLGPRGLHYQLHRLMQHRMPALAAQLACLCRGDAKGVARLGRGVARLDQVNELFAYFTHRSFDFQSRAPLAEDFDPEAYIRIVCEGLRRHVMLRERSQAPAPAASLPRHAPAGSLADH